MRIDTGIDTNAPATDEQIRDARSWVADCTWVEDANDLKRLSDEEIRAGIERNYDGGWKGFVEDGDYS